MDAESSDRRRGSSPVLRFTRSKRTSTMDEEFAGRATAKFERFLRAANQQDLASRRMRCALTRLAVGLIALTALSYILAIRERGEDTAPAAELTPLKREVCHAVMGPTPHSEPIEGICQVRP